MPRNFIKSGRTKAKIGQNWPLVTKNNCQKWSYGRSQEFHDSTEPLTSVISGETDKMRVELEKKQKNYSEIILSRDPRSKTDWSRTEPGPKKITKSRTSSKPGTEPDQDRYKFQATVIWVTL